MAETEASTETMEDFSKELEASFHKIKEGDLLTGTVIAVNDTEVTLDLGSYADGIILAQDYSDDPSFSIKNDVPIGEKITAKVIAEDNGDGHVLLSRKEAAQTLSWDILKKYMEEETVLTIKISDIVKGGAVAYAEGIRGFIPASRLSLSYVENLNEWLHKEIQVRVIQVEQNTHTLILSAKELLRKAAAEEESRRISNMQAGLVTEGVVEGIQSYGAFVRLTNGVTGFLHISQISNKRIKSPHAVLKEGQAVTVKIIEIKDGKIRLSMKALEEIAAEEIHEEVIELPDSETIGTSLGSLFKGIKLD